ncbi:MAG: fumarylacetoacetate hydrolase family protein [Rhodobacteraceae bacterium]|nr:fumarylacetoacetate hydrolase family protein [Paracoccaceae bacterium]
MQNYIIPSPPVVCIPTIDDRHFPVRRVYCIGRNYPAHASEMGHDPNREEPFFFQKNPDNLSPDGLFPYPAHSKEVHHEVELLVALQKGGSNIAPEDAMDCVWGYAVCLDMTLRDLQSQLKHSSRPWEVSKAFEKSAPVGLLVNRREVGDCHEGDIKLEVNGTVRQSGNLSQMIWKIPEIISHLSRFYDIIGGDVILTGTPSGVDSVSVGDSIRGSITGLSDLKVKIV